MPTVQSTSTLFGLPSGPHAHTLRAWAGSHPCSSTSARTSVWGGVCGPSVPHSSARTSASGSADATTVTRLCLLRLLVVTAAPAAPHALAPTASRYATSGCELVTGTCARSSRRLRHTSRCSSPAPASTSCRVSSSTHHAAHGSSRDSTLRPARRRAASAGRVGRTATRTTGATSGRGMRSCPAPASASVVSVPPLTMCASTPTTAPTSPARSTPPAAS
mmetsp:Transcript_20808/g.66881  ORF Transcript_20808/g.66881 Transcript_20808/m.66881 type:complete len:219 (+) Transcript_20808:855-1511(+)